ncbi:D-glycero-beta-D-manno-heptose 1,7-bisphosphate 7-phosphatase [Butyrivibrio sp. XB500-5]|nr:D-glycero-beta-D-manno-heptose 1,7-bisphosphate 7-phosphatase [Butyrivibrio sp. XB500-5]RKM59568.1 D-glycero-beta-D-manno-heptose 1,7-bisphosphate 7-phosphatase [Butyrivibrio sp. XB500-5]
MKTVIMAGGKGTRISELFPDIPKPLIPIKNKAGESKPVLEWEIQSLVEQGFKEIILTVSHMADKIQDYFGNGEQLGASITYFVEDTPLGNAGALFKMRDQLTEPFLLLNADAVFDVDFKRFYAAHMKKKEECGVLATLFTHPNSHPYDSGLIVGDSLGRVISWLTKEDSRPTYYKNRVNAGLHVIDPQLLDQSGIDAVSVGEKSPQTGKTIKVDLDRQLLKPLCNTGRMYCYDSPEYVKDMGTPERYEAVCRDYANGVVESKNLSHKQKAIFLDRDGTINKYVGFLRDIDQFELIDGVAEAVKRINESGYLCIVVTNQPVIARGEVTREQLEAIHMKMETELGKQGAYIDGLYYCPHHPDKGFEGEVKELKIECDCRKPKPGLLLHAAEDFNIDLTASWMIGDGDNDVGAGENAGCKTILLSNDLENTCNADIIARNLKEAIEQIL